MRSKTNNLVLRFLLLSSLTLPISGCTSSPDNEVDSNANRYGECEVLADKASALQLSALGSGETNYSSLEWQTYDQARDRYNILNCKEWWPLPYS